MANTLGMSNRRDSISISASSISEYVEEQQDTQIKPVYTANKIPTEKIPTEKPANIIIRAFKYIADRIVAAVKFVWNKLFPAKSEEEQSDKNLKRLNELSVDYNLQSIPTQDSAEVLLPSNEERSDNINIEHTEPKTLNSAPVSTEIAEDESLVSVDRPSDVPESITAQLHVSVEVGSNDENDNNTEKLTQNTEKGDRNISHDTPQVLSSQNEAHNNKKTIINALNYMKDATAYIGATAARYIEDATTYIGATAVISALNNTPQQGEIPKSSSDSTETTEDKILGSVDPHSDAFKGNQNLAIVASFDTSSSGIRHGAPSQNIAHNDPKNTIETLNAYIADSTDDNRSAIDVWKVWASFFGSKQDKIDLLLNTMKVCVSMESFMKYYEDDMMPNPDNIREMIKYKHPKVFNLLFLGAVIKHYDYSGPAREILPILMDLINFTNKCIVDNTYPDFKKDLHIFSIKLTKLYVSFFEEVICTLDE